MRVVASAPGKTILFGEHFVVKGTRAVATALSLRARVAVELSSESHIVIESKNLEAVWRLDLSELKAESKEAEPFVALLKALAKRGYKIAPHRAVIESEVPIAAGLGSSAATATAYALAYSRLLGISLSQKELFEITLESEQVAHGRPSGIDNALATWGGTIVYRRGEEPKHVKIDLKRLSSYSFIVMDTGVKRSTKAVVEHVLKLADKNWTVMKHIYEAADSLVSEAVKALEEGDGERIGELMNINHGLLTSLGASSLELDNLVNRAKSCGALGAKLTGAGWGGSAIAVVSRDRLERVLKCVEGYAVYVKPVEIHGVAATIEELQLR
ncbi:MAG: mevalonate kinase [Acidilobaceae archaeon]